MTSNLPPLKKFNCTGDAASLGASWDQWKRSFNNFLIASQIKDEEAKRATLLHTAGLGLQEIFYNIPGAEGSGEVGDKVYEIALQKLDNYFNPIKSKIYERHKFRMIQQEEDEPLDTFISRLKKQGEKCKFNNLNEEIIQQITEKCLNENLKKEILCMSDEDINLEIIIIKGNALQDINKQLKNLKKNRKRTQKKGSNAKQCSRCGSKNHFNDYIQCPAKNKRCHRCGYVGHYRELCRSRKRKLVFIRNEK